MTPREPSCVAFREDVYSATSSWVVVSSHINVWKPLTLVAFLITLESSTGLPRTVLVIVKAIPPQLKNLILNNLDAMAFQNANYPILLSIPTGKILYAGWHESSQRCVFGQTLHGHLTSGKLDSVIGSIHLYFPHILVKVDDLQK
jgi:hypothetical protein